MLAGLRFCATLACIPGRSFTLALENDAPVIASATSVKKLLTSSITRLASLSKSVILFKPWRCGLPEDRSKEPMATDGEILAGPLDINGTLSRWRERSDGSSVVEIWDGNRFITSDGSITLKDFFPPDV